jgi:N6-adenine-specific methylase
MSDWKNNFKNTEFKISKVLKDIKLIIGIIKKDGALRAVKEFGDLVNDILNVEEMCCDLAVEFKDSIDESCVNINSNLENIYKEFELLNEKEVLREIEENLTQNICILMEKLKLINDIKSFPFWYHKIELTNGIKTLGWAPINRKMYKIPEDMTGLRILDVGSWDGFWAFEALKRGARQVVAIDDFSDFLGRLENSDRKAWETFDLCKKTLGYTDEQCQRYDMSVYDISEEVLGRFDVVFFFGVLYHLRHPLLALDKVSSICHGEIYVETAILDDFSVFNGGFGKGYSGNQVVAEFYSDNQYGSNDTNWWVPSLSCLEHMLSAAGFKDIQSWKLRDNPNLLSECRGFACGKKI